LLEKIPDMKVGKSMGKAKQFGIGWCMAADNGEGVLADSGVIGLRIHNQYLQYVKLAMKLLLFYEFQP